MVKRLLIAVLAAVSVLAFSSCKEDEKNVVAGVSGNNDASSSEDADFEALLSDEYYDVLGIERE